MWLVAVVLPLAEANLTLERCHSILMENIHILKIDLFTVFILKVGGWNFGSVVDQFFSWQKKQRLEG
jgi:hypothetical protein